MNWSCPRRPRSNRPGVAAGRAGLTRAASGHNHGVARTEYVINATPDRVYAVLSDGWTYSDWVVGTAHIRDVDAGWPAHGTSLHHKVGPWPLSIRDSSHVLDSEPDRMLHLRVRVWPFGEAQVRI